MDLNEMKTRAISMSDKIYEMLELVEKGFMEHKTEFLSSAMEKERELNSMEKTLTEEIFRLSKTATQADRKKLSNMAQAVELFERMGDEAANLVERIEVKIHEKLLFSDLGVEQLNETHKAMKKSVSMLKDFLKNPERSMRERIIDNGFHVKELVERYRREHADRLVQGLCTPLGANMYFDMLDFTGNLARHSSTIAKLL